MTRKLYLEDPYLKNAKGRISSIREEDGKTIICLDQTIFYPEGGGQPADKGFIIYGDKKYEILDVQKGGDQVFHFIDGKTELKKGYEVEQRIDFERRYKYMVFHTGEHIISGLANKKFSCNNVGFHMGDDYVTCDFDKFLQEDELRELIDDANEVVMEDKMVYAIYPSKEELEKVKYRSKKEIEGKIRLLVIEDTDVCACSGLHLERTSKISRIRLEKAIKYKSGTRLNLTFGKYAYKNDLIDQMSLNEIANSYSCSNDLVLDRFNKERKEIESIKDEIKELKRENQELIISSIEEKDQAYFLEIGDSDIQDLRKLAQKITEKRPRVFLISKVSDKINFVMASKDLDIKPYLNAFKEKCRVKGGGKGKILQGQMDISPERAREIWDSMN